ncbi:hypothetical protein HY382_01800 [Candidatus Curtissbacteria bacterium]|nr:hypothetical protein [Candidatus Curtissbacteria bacterium]
MADEKGDEYGVNMDYAGVIIEESLFDKSLLDKVEVLSTKIEEVTQEHGTPWLKYWTLHTVKIKEINAQKTANLLSKSLDYSHGSAWYADFKNEKWHYIIFKNKIFKINRKKPKRYEVAANYGISLGIPAYQVDFSPAIEEWTR